MNTIRELTKLNNDDKIDITYPIELKNKDGNVVYYEDVDGNWIKYKYNDEGLLVYSEDSKGEVIGSNGNEDINLLESLSYLGFNVMIIE